MKAGRIAEALLLAALACAVPAEVRPEETELSRMSLDELMNIPLECASKMVEKQREAPATTIVITRDQIRRRNYRSLLEVLEDLPDIKIERVNDPRWADDVTIRGIFGMDKFLILQDGIRVSSTTNDVIPIMENYPVNHAQRIEIVYGPASALYGADAIAGIINIVTKRAEDVRGTVEGTVDIGRFGSYVGDFVIGKEVSEKISFTAAGQYFRDPQPDLSEYYPEEYVGGKDALRTGTFDTAWGRMTPNTPVSPDFEAPLGASAFHASARVHDFHVSFFRNHARFPSTIANNPNNAVYNENVYLADNITVIDGTYKARLAGVESTATVVVSSYEMDTQSNWRNIYTSMEPGYKFARSKTWKIEEQLSGSVADKLKIVGGLSYKSYFAIPVGHDLESPVDESRKDDPTGIIVNSRYPKNPAGIEADFVKLRYGDVASYLQVRYAPVKSLSLVVGARYDHNTRFGDSFNPRMGVIWLPGEKTTIKALFGSAFLAPSPQAAYEQFGSFYSTDEGETYRSYYFRLPNPDLGPQRMKAFEVSLRSFLSSNTGVALTGFYYRLSGLFRQVSDAEYGNRYDGHYKGWPVDYIEIMINQGEQRNYGGGIQLDHIRHFGTDRRLAAYMSLSLVDGRVDADGEGPGGNAEIGGVSPLMLKAGGELTIGRFEISPRLIAVSRQRTHPAAVQAFEADDPSKRQTLPGYVLVNVATRYRLSGNFTLLVDIRNMLDQRYRNVNLGAAPETGAQGSAAAEFSKGAPQYPIRVYAGLQFHF
ncbi:MAG: TonB-dependent receptor [Acidobacteriota bacterium]